MPMVASSLFETLSGLYSICFQQQHQQHRPAGSSPVGSQILPTIATPAHLQLKPLLPVTTTASTTQHHSNGISYSTFTHPGLAHLRPVNPQGVLQTQPVYYNTVASNSQQQQQQQQQQQSATYLRTPIQLQQQQQQRVPVYSTVATPLQKLSQFSHPVPQYPAYAFGQQSTGAAGLISGGSLYHHHHQQQQQQQPSAASNAQRLTYTNVPTVNIGGSVGGGVGGRGSIYLLH
ncbi:putative uncharacterized protein DDB_G0282129 [Anopheles aquasalis]|uniref:putative uncharacterized protein DDB_G0282129 n=1 Tax=Anopheles aquasalis TaxID=42839 RepID=UPI00215A4196|nr:putative uncharacterized protein DDB_G0282129 [Anopheles aquasalis]